MSARSYPRFDIMMGLALVRAAMFPLLSTVALTALLGGQAEAQVVDGALQGTVVSCEGTPEPQVVVTLWGPNLQGPRVTFTDRHGFYQFLTVPPGVYQIHLSRVGLQSAEVQQIDVELGRTTAIPPLTMDVRATTMEPMIVRAPRLTVHPGHTGSGGTLKTKEYASLPMDRDYKSMIIVLPQTVRSYRGDPVNVGGSTGLENQYYIDGVNVTDSKFANRATSLPYNFIRAVEVKTGGYEARFGRALGAVVNAVTYSGTNDFEMNAFGFVQPGELTMDAKMAEAVTAQKPTSYDWGVRLGGPLVRDRLWYSAAVNPRTDRIEKQITGHSSYVDRTCAVRYASKLTWKMDPKVDLEMSVFGDPAARDQVDAPLSGITTVTNPDCLLGEVKTGGTSASLRATAKPSAGVVLQVSAARQWDRFSDLPATALGRSELRYVDYTTGSCGGGRSTRWEEERGRTSLSAESALRLPGHMVVAGVDYEDAVLTSKLNDVTIWHQETERYMVGQWLAEGTFHNRSPAVYLQDSWRINDQVTLTPGIRWSGQYLVGASGRTAVRITDEWQPRVGFNWQLGRDARQQVFGTYGRFYLTLPTSIASMWFVDFSEILSYYSIDPRLPGAVPDSVFDVTTYEADWAKQIPGLQAENFDEFTLGYERLLGESTRLTVRGMRRDLRSSFQWGVDVSQDPWLIVLGTPGKGEFSFLPQPKREYTALEISAEGSWRSWRYRGSYVLSRTWGNYPGLYNSDFSLENPGQISTLYMPHQARNSTGFLPNDHPHVFKLNGSYTSRFGVTVGAIVTCESGSPINDFAAGPFMGPLTPSFLVPRGTAGRTPTLWDLNLRLIYDLPVRGPRAQILLDILHVGSPRRTTRVDEVHYLTLDEEGNPDAPNPHYRVPTGYQPPMAVSVGVQAVLW